MGDAKVKKISLEQINSLLSYDPDTGVFVWKVALSNRGPTGSIAGFKNVGGYRVIGIYGREYYAHRLAWFMSHGRWPASQIDHINGDRADNRLENLREASNRENGLNRKRLRRDNKTGATGVHFDRSRGQWLVTVGYKFIGRYKTLDDAVSARKERAEAVFGNSQFWTGI